MDRGKGKLKQQLHIKDESEKEEKASSASNPTFTDAHSGSPPSLVSKTGESSPEQENYHSSGARPKNSGSSGQAKQTDDSLHTTQYQVSKKKLVHQVKRFN